MPISLEQALSHWFVKRKVWMKTENRRDIIPKYNYYYSPSNNCNSINYQLISQQNFELHLAHKRNKGKELDYREVLNSSENIYTMQVTFPNSSKTWKYFNWICLQRFYTRSCWFYLDELLMSSLVLNSLQSGASSLVNIILLKFASHLNC